MHPDLHRGIPDSRRPSADGEAAHLVLRLARRLHRAATDGSPIQCLPVLRRILASDSLRGMSLPELHRSRGTVQRKHLLRMLAVEAGFASWEAYRHALDGMSVAQLTHFDLLRGDASYPNPWFASLAEAEAHAREHGGRALRVGGQAVVLDIAVQDSWPRSPVSRSEAGG